MRVSEYIARFVGGSQTSHEQYRLHQSPTINDCFYRNMYRFDRIAVIDFDEVSLLMNEQTVSVCARREVQNADLQRN